MCQFLQETYTNSSHKLLRLTVLIAQEMCYIGERLFVWPTDQSSVGSRCCNSFVSIYFVKKTSDELSFGHTLQQLPKFKVLFILGLYFYEKLSSALI